MASCIHCEQEGWRYDKFVEYKQGAKKYAYICSDCLTKLVQGHELAEKVKEAVAGD